MQRPDQRMMHRWHVAINQHVQPLNGERPNWGDARFMYEAKSAADELPRLTYLFKKEREGGLSKRLHMCSHDHHGADVPDNHLTCCLGVRCGECPFLKALDAAELTDEQRDFTKAWTCVTHIISKGGDLAREGYVLTVDDRMYWDNVYRSLSMSEEEVYGED
jgi:hypothetical protein